MQNQNVSPVSDRQEGKTPEPQKEITPTTPHPPGSCPASKVDLTKFGARIIEIAVLSSEEPHRHCRVQNKRPPKPLILSQACLPVVIRSTVQVYTSDRTELAIFVTG